METPDRLAFIHSKMVVFSGRRVAVKGVIDMRTLETLFGGLSGNVPMVLIVLGI